MTSSVQWPPLYNNHVSKTTTFLPRPLLYDSHLSKIGTVTIEIVQEYTYLGTRLTPTGNFTPAQEHLTEKKLYKPSLVYENIHFFIDLIPTPHHRFTHDDIPDLKLQQWGMGEVH